MDRVILHVDGNCFFASVELAYRPELKDKPVAVVGDKEARHGIILTANYIAKKGYGVKTGEPIFKAKEKCPELVTINSNPERYLHHSALMRAILADYSDNVEPFGCDEAWVDVTPLVRSVEDAYPIAQEISQRIKRELHITVSIGVSFCKVFAKFGSDYKKPDAITVITRENFRDIVWKSPCEDLIYVGRATKKRLAERGVYTIGDIATSSDAMLKSWLGKNGLLLKSFAEGKDTSFVAKNDKIIIPKSVGNSTTTRRDLVCNDDVKRVFYVLSDSVARRLREKNLCGSTVTIYLRRNDLSGMSHRCSLEKPVDTAFEIADVAMKLFNECYSFSDDKPIRSIGVIVSSTRPPEKNRQISLFEEETLFERRRAIELAMDKVRSKYGYYSILRGELLSDRELTDFNPKAEHKLHPVGDFNAVRPA